MPYRIFLGFRDSSFGFSIWAHLLAEEARKNAEELVVLD
jgi:hypothetical protein